MFVRQQLAQKFSSSKAALAKIARESRHPVKRCPQGRPRLRTTSKKRVNNKSRD
jgi:hypothetical protein